MNYILVIRPIEHMRWYLMNMMSVRLSSDILINDKMTNSTVESLHQSYRIHMELLFNLNV